MSRSITAGRGPKQKVRFKTEAMDVDIAPVSTPSTPLRARVRPRKQKDTTNDGEDIDELASSTSDAEYESPTPRAKGGRAEPSGKKGKGIVILLSCCSLCTDPTPTTLQPLGTRSALRRQLTTATRWPLVSPFQFFALPLPKA